jgi:hypothetical protein
MVYGDDHPLVHFVPAVLQDERAAEASTVQEAR